ncbi:MAG TPA: DoxX family protein [Rhodanobacteraceae bacterium]|nr:DoxX family protein [Rhodanobacteraceae bacterium]
MKTLSHGSDLLGRLFLVLLFVISGFGKIGGYAGTAAYMAANGVPGLLLPLVIVLEIGGGILVVLGWHTRIASLLLAGFTILALLLFHMPVTAENQIVFLAELGVAGGFLVLAAHGAGAWSLDAWLVRRTPAKAVAA